MSLRKNLDVQGELRKALARPTGADQIGAADGGTVQDALTVLGDDLAEAEAALTARPTSDTLAASGGAGLVGSNDGAGGSLWSTVAGFITYLRSSVGSAVVGFIQVGIGAVARTVQTKLRDTVSVKDFGAVGNGATNDTAAFQAALDAIKARGGGEVVIPQGTYLITSTLLYDGQRFNIRGDGRQASVILFNPASTSVCFNLDTPGAGGQNQSTISGLGFTSSNTVNKTAIRLYNVANVRVSEIAIANGGWQGTGSIGVRTFGRQFVTIENCEILCARPIVFSANPVWPSLGVDHFKVLNCEIGSTEGVGNATIDLGNGVAPPNLTIRGNAIVLGAVGIRGVDTTSGAASFNVRIDDNRFEQGADASAYCIDLDYSTYSLQTLVCVGNHYDSTRNGLRLRGALRVHLIGEHFPQSGARVNVNIDLIAGSELNINGCYGANGVKTITNARAVQTNAENTATVWSERYVFNAGFASGAQQSDVYFGGVPFTLAPDAVVPIADNNFTGFILVSTGEDVSAIYELRGPTNATAEVADLAGFFTPTKDSASAYNIYWDGPTSRYVIQSKRPVSAPISVYRIGTTA
jgi:hypothetical protein